LSESIRYRGDDAREALSRPSRKTQKDAKTSIARCSSRIERAEDTQTFHASSVALFGVSFLEMLLSFWEKEDLIFGRGRFHWKCFFCSFQKMRSSFSKNETNSKKVGRRNYSLINSNKNSLPAKCNFCHYRRGGCDAKVEIHVRASELQQQSVIHSVIESY
tara:strand:- start:909 stop:1391 length:483 start_codon:yes stop_codon:yes gene_type:complete